MKHSGYHFLKHCLSAVLALGSMTQVSAYALSDTTTTLALVYDELSSVFNCAIQETVSMTLVDIKLVTIEILESQRDQKIHTYSQCDGIIQVYDVPSSSLALIPVDPLYTSGDQFNLSGIDLQAAWDITIGSPEIIVAVIDTGVNTTSPLTDFGSDGLVLGAAIIDGFVKEDTYVSQFSYDGGSHGTAVASLISANMNSSGITGVAPGVKIMPLKVFRDAITSGEVISAKNTDIAAAILWAVNHGADIINMSLGGTGDISTENAVKSANAQGVILVAASGNNSTNDSDIYRDVSFPAAYPEVIAVGSLTNTQTVSNFSNISGTGIDLSAYGERIALPWLALNSFAYGSGTSFSAPTVAGVLALLKSVDPTLSPQEAKAILLSGVIDIVKTDYALGWDKWTGYGMVNALNTLLQAQDFMSYSDTNFDWATAEFIYGKHTYVSQLRPVLDTDYFKFTLYEPDDVTITVATESIQDLMFQVFNANQTSLAIIDEDGSAVDETVTLINVPVGSYIIKVTDFEGRAIDAPYTIAVDYASNTLPQISASNDFGNVYNGQLSHLPVQISVQESLYHTISVTKDSVTIALPENRILSEIGTYVVSVDDVINPVQQFTFTIGPASGVQDNGYYNTDRTLFFVGVATLNGEPFLSGSTLSTEGEYTLIITNGETVSTIHFVLDKTNPVITIQPYSTEPTNQDVIITASVNEGSLNALSHTFTENGSYIFIATDLSGNRTEHAVTITHIHKVKSISINKSNTLLYGLGSTEALLVTVTPSDAVDKRVLWVSSNSDIVSVSAEGVLKSVGIGSATITATSVDGNYSDDILVEVILSRHLTFEVIGAGASLNVSTGETIIVNESDVVAGAEITFSVTLGPRHRIYQWVVNGEVQPNKTSTLVTTIGPSNLNVQVEPGLIGDLNLTNEVSTTDLVLLRRYLAGLESLDPKDIFNADMNADGFVTTTDLVKLRRYLAGLE